MLKELQAKLGTAVPIGWSADVQAAGDLVRLYRDYAAGEHRAKLTEEMRAMLRISDGRGDQFALNYCDMIVAKMADRLRVDAVRGDNDAGTAWADAVMTHNRMDALQIDVCEAALRDGVTYVMVAYDNADQMPVLAHELAWDGEVGMIAVYDRMGKNIIAAIKVWIEGENKRINIYRPGMIEKYIVNAGGTVGSGAMRELGSERWELMDGSPIGVPVVAIINRARPRLTTGISEIAGIIPLQDALNRTLVSMVMTAELTAFQIRVARGFSPPAKLTPGVWVIIAEGGLETGQVADVSTMEQGQLVPFIDQAKFLIDQISTISSTPLPGAADSGASGEALKERQVGLLSKVRRFQVRAGNAWEDVIALALRVQLAYGRSRPPVVGRWSTSWADAEIRNDSEMVDNALKLRELVGDRETLRLVAGVYGWDEAAIDRIIMQREEENTNALARLGGTLPGFDAFRLPVGEVDPAGDPAMDPAGDLVM